MPSAEAAVCIAAALGVTVEYLITGNKPQEHCVPPQSLGPRALLKNLESLNKRDQKIVLNLIKFLKQMEELEGNKAPLP
ncbi:MAG: hypothetical protein FWC65_02280 [Treponema sp.]|nr:hypothetical protein [Treponema sp.]